ncbi:MAG: glutathione synthase, partial [Gammaproteobacteria bacterium]|nr:glutathione synthase [Gammaproteobacteria bacterium]
MTIKLGIIMDPIETIKPHKDTSLAMLLEAQRRGWQIYYMQQTDLFIQDHTPHGYMHLLTVQDDKNHWFNVANSKTLALTELDVILMRKDPPVDMSYINTTHLLELAEKKQVLVVNSPQALRDVNEKLFTTWFPQCCPAMLVSNNIAALKKFAEQQQTIVIKPVDGMGGAGVFRLQHNDANLTSALELLTNKGKILIIAQQFIPEIAQGDKRILLINGKPIPYALARIPAPGETRGNLAAGGKGIAVKLTERDHWICQQVGPTLKEKGLLFVGLDVIGDYLTEIN